MVQWEISNTNSLPSLLNKLDFLSLIIPLLCQDRTSIPPQFLYYPETCLNTTLFHSQFVDK